MAYGDIGPILYTLTKAGSPYGSPRYPFASLLKVDNNGLFLFAYLDNSNEQIIMSGRVSSSGDVSELHSIGVTTDGFGHCAMAHVQGNIYCLFYTIYSGCKKSVRTFSCDDNGSLNLLSLPVTVTSGATCFGNPAGICKVAASGSDTIMAVNYKYGTYPTPYGASVWTFSISSDGLTITGISGITIDSSSSFSGETLIWPIGGTHYLISKGSLVGGYKDYIRILNIPADGTSMSLLGSDWVGPLPGESARNVLGVVNIYGTVWAIFCRSGYLVTFDFAADGTITQIDSQPYGALNASGAAAFLLGRDPNNGRMIVGSHGSNWTTGNNTASSDMTDAGVLNSQLVQVNEAGTFVNGGGTIMFTNPTNDKAMALLFDQRTTDNYFVLVTRQYQSVPVIGQGSIVPLAPILGY